MNINANEFYKTRDYDYKHGRVWRNVDNHEGDEVR